MESSRIRFGRQKQVERAQNSEIKAVATGSNKLSQEVREEFRVFQFLASETRIMVVSLT